MAKKVSKRRLARGHHVRIAQELVAKLRKLKLTGSIYCSKTSSSVYVRVRRSDDPTRKVLVRISDHPQDYIRNDNQTLSAIETIYNIGQVAGVCEKLVDIFERKQADGKL